MNNLLVTLVNLWDVYETGNPSPSIADFCAEYLLKQQLEQKVLPGDILETETAPMTVYEKTGKTFGRVSRMGIMYSKKALENLRLSSAIDYGFLAELNERESATKSELIQICVIDFTTGIEVIRRLARYEYIEEYPDPDDRRSKRVRITPLGKKVVVEGRVQLKKMGKFIFGGLKEEEAAYFYRMLKKIDTRHTEILKDVRHLDFEELCEKQRNSK